MENKRYLVEVRGENCCFWNIQETPSETRNYVELPDAGRVLLRSYGDDGVVTTRQYINRGGEVEVLQWVQPYSSEHKALKREYAEYLSHEAVIDTKVNFSQWCRFVAQAVINW